MLEVAGLTHHFGGLKALDGLSFRVDSGERVALIGPNGAGKTTCFHLLTGLMAPTGGSVHFEGENITARAPARIARCGIGRTFQRPAIFTGMTVLENVQMALLTQRLCAPGYLRSMASDAALAALERTGLAERAQHAATTLSYGHLKRLELAMIIARRPRLLLIDEPTAGLDHDERHSLMDMLVGLHESAGLSVLFIEHAMDITFAYAQRIIVLHRGRVLASGSVEAVRRDSRVQEVYLGAPLC